MTDHEEFKNAEADREPTPAEEAAAEEVAADVDVEAVAEEYEHMTGLGATVRGEGQIEGDDPVERAFPMPPAGPDE